MNYPSVHYPQTYVQHILEKNLEDVLVRTLFREEGHVYVCGQIEMARDVATTIKRIIAKKKGLSNEEVEKYLTQLKVYYVLIGDLYFTYKDPQQASAKESRLKCIYIYTLIYYQYYFNLAQQSHSSVYKYF